MSIDESPSNVEVSDLAAEIVGTAGRLAAATCRWLLLIARFDAGHGWQPMGFASTGRWLAYACGLSARTAFDHVRAARALAMFPALAESMGAGRLSYSHLRAISRIAAEGDDALVERLVMVGEHGTVAHLEAIVRGLQTVDDNEHRTTAGWPEPESVSHGWTSGSQWRLSARLDPERGALVQSAIAAVAAAEDLNREDALIRVAEIALAAIANSSGLPVLRGDERAAVVIHLDAAARPAPAEESGSAEPTRDADPERADERVRPYARIANGPGLPERVVKRLLCAGRIRTAVRDGTNGTVLDLGRSRRLVTDRQYRALLIRDHGHCQAPGCPNTRGLEAHHVIHWLDGGRTDLKNLILLCPRHHHAHHDGEFNIRAEPGSGQRFRFTTPTGTLIPDHVDPAEFIRSTVRLEREHSDVWATAATPIWDGQRLDRHYAIGCLAELRTYERDREPA